MTSQYRRYPPLRAAHGSAVRRLAGLTLTAALVALPAGAALAAGSPGSVSPPPGSLPPGVHVNPNSPAGTEYQIPISATRGETAGGSSATGSGAPPLFGVGVTPTRAAAVAHRGGRAGRRRGSAKRGAAGSGPDSGGAAGVGSGAGSDGARGAGAGGGSAVAYALTRHELASLLSGPAAGTAGGNAWLALIAGGALIFVLGGGGGLLLRRRLGPA